MCSLPTSLPPSLPPVLNSRHPPKHRHPLLSPPPSLLPPLPLVDHTCTLPHQQQTTYTSHFYSRKKRHTYNPSLLPSLPSSPRSLLYLGFSSYFSQYIVSPSLPPSLPPSLLESIDGDYRGRQGPIQRRVDKAAKGQGIQALREGGGREGGREGGRGERVYMRQTQHLRPSLPPSLPPSLLSGYDFIHPDDTPTPLAPQ